MKLCARKDGTEKTIMEPVDKQNSSNKGTIVATGIICSIIGGIVGAIGTYMYDKNQKENYQHTRYSNLKFRFGLKLKNLNVSTYFDRLCSIVV